MAAPSVAAWVVLATAATLVMSHGFSDIEVHPSAQHQQQESRGVERFLKPGLGASVLLLEPERGALFVGARGAVLRLTAANVTSKPSLVIPWEANDASKQDCRSKGRTEDECHNHVRALHLNGSRLLACGTGAFSPVCAHFDPESGHAFGTESGKDKCPYDPAQAFSSVLVDEDLYSATMRDFLGRNPGICRSSASQTLVRTEDSAKFLRNPAFVASEVVEPGEGGGGRHVYFFFTETAMEYDYIFQPRVARIARVCTGDSGGQRVLQKRWTSFVKLRLECSVAELQLPFSILRDVSTLRPAHSGGHGDNSDGDMRFYALLSSQWGDLPYSAVCEYTLSDVEEAFARPPKRPFTIGPAGSSRTVTLSPGTCITPKLRALGIESSQDLPDDYLAWMQDHPRLQETLRPREGLPLLLSRSHAYTRVAAATATALDNRTHLVLYLGTRNGSLHKAVRVDGKTHIVSQTQLFAHNESILSIVVSASTGTLYVAASSGVAQLSLHGCAMHGGCERCLLVRDPFCAWDTLRSLCTALRAGDSPRELLQNLTMMESDVGLKCGRRGGTHVHTSRSSSVTELPKMGRSMVASGASADVANAAADDDADGRRQPLSKRPASGPLLIALGALVAVSLCVLALLACWCCLRPGGMARRLGKGVSHEPLDQQPRGKGEGAATNGHAGVIAAATGDSSSSSSERAVNGATVVESANGVTRVAPLAGEEELL
ncbi:semaphorin-4D-like isoform X2 [Lethenteron reissneri]|uniref:semaphorin-4D-like isoform X2 n=1 Tax=Lethenteron reissneri TaxID=7753 RepID=UPI002AB73BD1|nr:semaphorin-4D-like isoform X2 [Lethenteron reissneri]